MYRPTPIKLLEKLEAKSHAEIPPETEKKVEFKVPLAAPPLPSVPVYQPTPISELEKYAPSSLAAYGLPNGTAKSSFLASSDPPTYSPVVRPKQVTGSDTTAARLNPVDDAQFLYQPSPAYPPVTEEIDLTTDSCDEPDATPQKDPMCASESTSKTRPSSTDKTRIVKRKHSEQKGPKVNPPIDSGSISSNKPPKTCQCSHTLAAGEPPETDCAIALKRQKLLSLYQDLYGDESPLEENVDKNEPPTKKSGLKVRSTFPPYQGELPTKVVKKQTGSVESPQSQASQPSVPVMPRPLAPLRKSDKIPMPIRTRYLNQFIEECLIIYQSPNDAYERALNDEQACHDKATSRMAYLNAVIQRLKSLKAEKTQVEKDGVKLTGSGTSTPRATMISSSTVKQTSSPVTTEEDSSEKRLNEVVRGPLFYEQLRPYLLDEEALVANGFPREDKRPGAPRGRAILSVPEEKRSIYSSCQENERICTRCGARFIVDEYGNALASQKCVYHWSRPVKLRTPVAGIDLRYPCCQGEIGQPGCQICPTGHVHEANKWLDPEGFVTTLPPLPSSLREQTTNRGDDEEADATSTPVNIYALDCEMVYTTAGCELARCTIVDSRFHTVMDCVVRPDHMVLDCNTRFSGLTQAEVESAELRITDVQAKLLHLFDSDSILIGHSLESDLTALKLIHSKVVDTSIVFPHRLGPPKKRALRNLVGDYLHRIIQQGECGHNSLEDASACMELMQYKVKEDLRRGKWIFKKTR